MIQNLKIAIYSLTATILLLNSNLAYASCDIKKAIYKDTNKKGFELRFNDPPQNSALLFATATLWHPKRGNISIFEVGSYQGFGTIYFSPKSAKKEEIDAKISAYFFSSKLTEFNQQGASPYMFISGLGSWDWYDNQMSGGRETVLGNPMWKLDRCR